MSGNRRTRNMYLDRRPSPPFPSKVMSISTGRAEEQVSYAASPLLFELRHLARNSRIIIIVLLTRESRRRNTVRSHQAQSLHRRQITASNAASRLPRDRSVSEGIARQTQELRQHAALYSVAAVCILDLTSRLAMHVT